jgi:hypothetical protein
MLWGLSLGCDTIYHDSGFLYFVSVPLGKCRVGLHHDVSIQNHFLFVIHQSYCQQTHCSLNSKDIIRKHPLAVTLNVTRRETLEFKFHFLVVFPY